MDIEFRDARPEAERETILEFHCFNNYQSETPFSRSISYEEYRKNWLESPQPEEVIQLMEKDLNSGRNMVQFALIEDKVIGFLWVRFEDCDMKMLDTYITQALIYGIGVSPEYQKQGIGTKILSHIEKEACERGATLIRSEAGIENVASQKLHEKCGFYTYQISYEKQI